MKKLIIGLCMVVGAGVFSACNERRPDSEKLLELERKALVSPRAKADSLLELAANIRKDAVSRYLDTALQARDYGAAEKFDSSNVLLLKVAGFCRSQAPSQRLYNLLYYTENTFGSNLLYGTSSADSAIPPESFSEVSRVLNESSPRNTSDMAVLAYSKAAGYAQKAGNYQALPLVYYNLSQLYSAKDQLSLAAYYSRRALFVADSIGSDARVVNFFRRAVGESYIGLQDFDNAKKALDQTMKTVSALSPEDRAAIFQDYGKIYVLAGDGRKALDYFRRALELIRHADVGADYSYYTILMEYVSCCITVGQDLPQAKKAIDESLRFFEKSGQKDEVLNVRVLELRLALKEQRLAEAAEVIRQALAEGVETDAATDATKLAWYKSLDTFYRIKGNPGKAYPYFRKAVELDNSIRGFVHKEYVADLDLRYQQDTTLLNSKIKAEHQDNEIRTLNWKFFTAIMGGVFLALCFAGYFFYNRRRRAMQNQQYLSSINRLKMQNIRNCISPHFTFNMLNREILLSPENGEVYNRLMDLAHLLRRCLDVTSQVAIPLSEELDFTQTYIKVLQKCGKPFAFRLHIDEAVQQEKTLIPSMIIQIPVENAIKHGFTDEVPREDWAVDITIKDRQTGICIEIVNNGEAYSPFNSCDADRKGIGMQVIYKSLLLMNQKNKEKITFHISDRSHEPTQGTRVSIYVPYHFDYTL